MRNDDSGGNAHTQDTGAKGQGKQPPTASPLESPAYPRVACTDAAAATAPNFLHPAQPRSAARPTIEGY